jgi:predicted dehydrogenase
VAIVGCGLVGTKRAAALPDGSELVAVYDADRSRARALAGDRAAIATSASGAIGHPDVDLVIVATPHDALADLALEAVGAGRHVLIEKPGAVSAPGADAVRREAAKLGRSARVGFNHRFHPALREARRLVSDGGYGAMMFLRARYGHGGRIGYEREWRADATRSGGGELIDQGIHLIDLTRYLAGDVTLAFSDLRTSYWSTSVEDNAFLALRCDDGALAWLHASWTEWKNLFSIEIMLERAKVEIMGLGGSYGVETLTLYEMLPEMGPPTEQRWSWDGSDTSWRDELVDVFAAIDGRQAVGASIDDAVAALDVVDEAYAAARARNGSS